MNPQQNNNPAQGPAVNNIYPKPAAQSNTPIYNAQASDTDIDPVLPPASGSPLNSSKASGSNHHNLKSILSTILLLAIAPLIAFAITAFAIQSYQVDGESMQNTLQNNDRLIVDKIPRTIARISGHTYIPHRGDIIIFNQANLPDSSFGETKQLIKRVIGLPGERVVVKDGKITIYNKDHINGINPDTSNGYHISAPITSGDVDTTLQANQIFVCGDNRPNSEDSRYFGPVDANNIVGKLVLRLLPINKAEKF